MNATPTITGEFAFSSKQENIFNPFLAHKNPASAGFYAM
jgi:hypothetical protein